MPGSELDRAFGRGSGVRPVLVQAPGKIYLAGEYQGAPFSVVAITSAHVGPFDLGTVVVHLRLDINPHTATVSIPAGPADQIPHIIKGIVIHLLRSIPGVCQPSRVHDQPRKLRTDGALGDRRRLRRELQ